MVESSPQVLSEAAARFLADALELTSVEALDRSFLQWVQALGFESALFIRLARAGSAVEPQVLFGQSHPWVQYYAQQNYARLDPTIARAFKTRNPFTWREVENPDGSPQERQLFREARDSWAQDALVAPVHGPIGEFSLVNLLSDHAILLGPAAVRILQSVCAVYASLGITLLEGALPSSSAVIPVLTRRERQSLYWMCQGKRDSEIARILGISSHTVREYINGAKVKFGVLTRPELARKAAACGLLALGVGAAL